MPWERLADNGPDVDTTVHQLKTWPTYFARVWSGEKTFEVRFNDRGYQAGDVLELLEYDTSRPCACRLLVPPSTTVHHGGPGKCARYTGRSVLARVGYVLSGTPNRGPHQGHDLGGNVVMSLCDPVRNDDTGGGDAVPAVVVGPVVGGGNGSTGTAVASGAGGGGDATVTVTHGAAVLVSPQTVADAMRRAGQHRGARS